jgi:2-iminoacetate synthase
MVKESLEYRVDIEREDVKQKIDESKKIYQTYYDRFRFQLDFGNPNNIHRLYDLSKNEGIFEKAKDIRSLIYGKDMHYYGVIYLSDLCENQCKFCPGSMDNDGRELRMMTIDQAVEETKQLAEKGFKEICYLTGEYPGTNEFPDYIISRLKKIDELDEDFEIILNIPTQTTEGFRKIKKAVKNKKLQFRVFQETYNPNVYSEMIPSGPKADYDFRRQSQARALDAGFDNVGLGALFGLNRYPLEEIEGLKQHFEDIKKEYKIAPKRVALPFANKPSGCNVTVPYLLDYGQERNTKDNRIRGEFKANIYEKTNELIYALARLAMPTTGIVSSERDTPEMLEILDNYATCSTLGVQDRVGGNLGEYEVVKKGDNQEHFEQATTYPRYHEETLNKMIDKGYFPIIKK